MSLIEIPASTKCRCDRCEKEQGVPSDMGWPTQWAEFVYRYHPSTPHEPQHLCRECAEAMIDWLAGKEK